MTPAPPRPARALALGLLVVAAAAGCAPAPLPHGPRPGRMTPVQTSVRPASAAPARTPGEAGGAHTAAEIPRSDAERSARTAALLGGDRAVGRIVPVAGDPRYAFALEHSGTPGGVSTSHLLLFDFAVAPVVLIGRHDFGAPSSDTVGIGRARLERAFSLGPPEGERVLLAEMVTPDEDEMVGACGWWLRSRGATFLCAPKLRGKSSYDVAGDLLIESWRVALPTREVLPAAGELSGRVLRFSAGQWKQEDSFRCLGTPLAAARAEAGGLSLARWQRRMVAVSEKAARYASDRLDTGTAIARLTAALEVDGCDPETWRRLGRLEFESGRIAAAAPTLAMAFTLAPRDDGALLDLADALGELASDAPGRESWRSTLAVLESKPTTRALVQESGASTPRGLARALYRAFLERTSSTDRRLTSRRRRAEQKLEALEASEGRRP